MAVPVGPRPISVSAQVMLIRSRYPASYPAWATGSDRFSFVKFAVADPCHPQTADFDQDPANGAQQFVLFGRANQSLVTLIKRLQGPVQSGQFLLRPLALDTLGNPVSCHLKRLESV